MEITPEQQQVLCQDIHKTRVLRVLCAGANLLRLLSGGGIGELVVLCANVDDVALLVSLVE